MESEGLDWRDMGWDAFVKAVAHLDETRIKIGIVPPRSDEPSDDGRLSLGVLAHILEFGTRHIPARPFINGVITPHAAMAESRKIAEAIIKGEHPDGPLREAGRKFVARLREHAEFGNFVANAVATIKKKGFNHPLVDTGKLIAAIDYILIHEGGNKIAGGLDAETEAGPVSATG